MDVMQPLSYRTVSAAAADLNKIARESETLRVIHKKDRHGSFTLSSAAASGVTTAKCCVLHRTKYRECSSEEKDV